MHRWCGRGWGEPLQTLVTGHLVSRVNGQHAEDELSITGGLGSGRLTDIKMVLGVFLPIFLNAGHWQPSMDSAQVQSGLSQMLRLLCGYGGMDSVSEL